MDISCGIDLWRTQRSDWYRFYTDPGFEWGSSQKNRNHEFVPDGRMRFLNFAD